MTFGSLFSGIGGMDLGLERAGMACSWQVEIDPFCRKVLAKHWPDVPRHDDVRTFPDGDIDRWRVDLIAGGFPCQDISIAGPCIGIDGPRSGLWSEYSRILRLLRPRFALIENVAALTFRGMGRVLADLAALGFDAEWSMLSACSMGAPHVRQRLFILAHANGQHGKEGMVREPEFHWERQIPGPHDQERRGAWRESLAGAARNRDGIPDRVERIRGIGNAVAPDVAEHIGRRIMEAAS